jgi:hypothetical protein
MGKSSPCKAAKRDMIVKKMEHSEFFEAFSQDDLRHNVQSSILR